ncbi:MAG: S41 family peptidase [Actinobacteria bacterium]|nr:MAG: S41 family peptidase [Actinomycetota bacterium]
MTRRFAYTIVVVLVLVAISLTFATGFFVGHMLSTGREIPVVQRPSTDAIVAKARDLIRDNYVGKVSESQLNNGAIDGMMKSLKDPYSEYIPPNKFDVFQQHAMGEFHGVGVTLGMRDKKLTVIAPLPDTPAEKAGIKAGDLIVTIDGKSTAKMTLPGASEKIRGPKGTKVKLGIVRGKKKLSFSLTRAEINIPTVQSSMLAPGAGFIAVRSFTPSTPEDFEEQLKRLEKKGAKGVIVDLRSNPGGLVESSVELASLFIPDGTIVGMKRQDGELETMSAVEGYHSKVKLVMLVNGESASASEIVAGAVQDHKRGVVVGTKTFGKASVQTIETLANGGALKITSAHYYTPKRRLIQKVGIRPDVVVKGSTHWMVPGKPDPQKDRGLQVLKELISGKRP